MLGMELRRRNGGLYLQPRGSSGVGGSRREGGTSNSGLYRPRGPTEIEIDQEGKRAWSSVSAPRKAA